jgi:hypothetical protein
VTVKIPQAGPESSERIVVPPPQAVTAAAATLPRVAPAAAPPPAAVSPPREDLWQLLDTPPQTPSARAAAEELAEDRRPMLEHEPTATPPAAPAVPSLDLASLDLGLAQLPD